MEQKESVFVAASLNLKLYLYCCNLTICAHSIKNSFLLVTVSWFHVQKCHVVFVPHVINAMDMLNSVLQGEVIHARLTNPRGLIFKSSVGLEKNKLEEEVQQLQLKITELER